MTRDWSVIRRHRCASLQTLARSFTVLIFSIGTATLAAAQSPIATIGLTPGWATFGQAAPQGAAPSGLQAGLLLTQTDVKTRWPDGSIRFAIVSVNVPTAGNYAITAAPIASGAFTPALPTASVALTIGAVTYTATLPAAVSNDLWLSGALVYEGRSVVAPVSSADGSAHPFLRVIFDTRVYADGTGRVDVTVENVLDKVGATTVTYNATITVNGQAVFTRTAVQHYYLTRWRKMFTFGSTSAAAITPDMMPFNISGALPPYLPSIVNMVSSPTGASYEILQSGALTTNMPDHGGRPELAPYPDWTARYLVHKNQTQRTFVLANGDLAGSWPIHVREAESSLTTGVGSERLVSINQRPILWLDERAQGDGYDYVKGSPMPIREYGSTIPGPGQSPLIPDNAHQPSLAYVPYLLTGDRYYAEEMAFWANYAMIRTYPGDGVRSSSGVIENNEVRGYGWGLRNIVDAAAMYPDASPVRAYLTAKVNANLLWLDNYANSQDLTTNPFQIMWLFKRPDGNQYISMWEQTYLMHAIDRARQQGFNGGLLHRDAIARFQLNLFSSDPDYPRAQAAPYIVAVGVPGATLTVRAFTFFTTMAQIWAGTQGQERAFAGYYGPEARMSLMVGIQNGWVGAQAAYDYLWPFIGTTSTYCPDGGPDVPDLACRAGWALALPTPPPPAPTITWPAPSAIVYGTALGATQLNATANAPGTFVYSPAAGAVLAAGTRTLSVTFTPDDSTAWQTATATVSLTVTKATPTITWASPADIVYGTALGATQLNATASVSGSFAYVPASGTVLSVGSGQTLSVTFTPTDTANYNVATMAVTINVNSPPTVTLSATTAGAGGVVNATVANGPAQPGDFVGLYDAAGAAITWNYLNGTRTMPAAGVANATVPLSLPPTAGTYQARFFGAGYTLLATSASITTTMPTLTLSTASGRAGGTVTATVANGPGTPGDFVGIYDAGGAAVSWLYLNGTQVKPAAGLPSATVTLTLPATAGTFEVRLYNSTYIRMAGASIVVTIPPTVTLNKTTANAGGTVAATVANGPAAPGDFVGLYDSAGANVTWFYLNGTRTMPATGLSGATISFTLPATAGTYHARFYDATYSLLATSGNVSVTLPSVTLGASTGTTGGTVSATITNAPGTPGDWAGLYDATGNAVTWQYLNGTQTMPAAGVSSAVLSFILPAVVGTYHVRLFNGSYMRVATSGTITTSSPSVTLSAATANAGGRITATIAGGPGAPGDWAGLYDAAGNAVQWQYMNGTQVKPSTGLSNAVLTFNLPATAGTYQVRLFNSIYILIATSGSVTTTAPTVTLNAATGNAGGVVTATITNAPGTPGDWVGLYDNAGNVVGWKYLNGTQTKPATGVSTASVPFTLPAAAGTYYVRLSNDLYVPVATSGTIVTTVATVTPSATTVTLGSTVNVSIMNAPGTAGDWAGLYDAAGNALQWQYLNGTHTMPSAGVTSATLTFAVPSTPGTYQVRLFNGVYTLIAVSAPLLAN